MASGRQQNRHLFELDLHRSFQGGSLAGKARPPCLSESTYRHLNVQHRRHALTGWQVLRKSTMPWLPTWTVLRCRKPLLAVW